MLGPVRPARILVLTALVLTATAPAAGGGPAPALQLPDLVQEPPADLSLVGSGRSVRLGFRSATRNVGEGPLTVVGRRISGREVMRASQELLTADGTTVRRGRAGRLRFVRSEDHRHWHYGDFMRYELRRMRSRRLVRPGLKTGFCLGDRYDFDPATRLPAEPETAVYVTNCGRDAPGLSRIREGISVGYADHYLPHLEGQFFDISDLRGGRYWLVHRADAGRRLLELDDTNNASSLLIRLRRRPARGGRERLRLHVLRTCAGSAYCAAPARR